MTLKMRFSLGIALTSLLLLSFSKTPVQQSFEQVLNHFKSYTEMGSDKVYVQTDKPYYTSGETIWFKAYLVDAIRHLKSPHSRVVYVELVNPDDSIIARRRLHVPDVGAAGDLRLSPDWPSGNYTLRAYTQYMRNAKEQHFYRQSIPVWYQDLGNRGQAFDALELAGRRAAGVSERPTLTFYPEGGELVAGLKAKMGIKLTDSSGKGLSMEGSLVDNSDQAVAAFRTFDFGLGVVSFQPEAGKTYRAEVTIDGTIQTYPIPAIKPAGYALSINNLGKSLEVKVAASAGKSLVDAFLIGHMRGSIFLEQQLTAEMGSSYGVQLSTEELPDGVAQFTLYTGTGEPVCERLVFVDNPTDDLEVDVKTNQSAYGTRDQVKVDIALNDPAGRPIIADLSLAITDVSAVSVSPYSENIKSWLLLNSDLRGAIENPGFFFSEPLNGKRRYLLDALMLTHGWRKFIWSELPEQPLSYPGEQGIYVQGKTTRLGQTDKPIAAYTALNVLEGGLFQNEQFTDSTGRFVYGPYLFQDTVEIVIQARRLTKNTKKNKKKLAGDRNLSIELDTEILPPKVEAYLFRPYATDESLLDNYLSISQNRKRNDRIFDGFSVDFDEITVTGRRKQKSTEEVIESSVGYYGEPTRRLVLDSLVGTEGNSLFDILMRMPGLQVSGTYPTQTVQIRGNVSFQAGTSPLFLLDGNPVDQTFVSAMRAHEVFFVDLLTGPEAAIYGTRGANGVIAVYSAQGSRGSNVTARQPGIINFTHPGLYKARQFFSPDYTSKTPDHQKPDLRTTLYWEPNIFHNGEKGASSVDFYTCDNTGTYLLRIEGISSTGQLIYETAVIEVK